MNEPPAETDISPDKEIQMRAVIKFGDSASPTLCVPCTQAMQEVGIKSNRFSYLDKIWHPARRPHDI